MLTTGIKIRVAPTQREIEPVLSVGSETLGKPVSTCPAKRRMNAASVLQVTVRSYQLWLASSAKARRNLLPGATSKVLGDPP
jgi:hypothetical protein